MAFEKFRERPHDTYRHNSLSAYPAIRVTRRLFRQQRHVVAACLLTLVLFAFLAAGAGVGLAPLVGAGRAIGQGFGQLVGRLPTGTIPTAIGVAGGAAIGMMDGGAPAQVRFTRKQQAQVKEMVELIGFEAAMSILGVDAATLAFMLTKKFPRRGQGITAAQLRTATRVNNKIIHMHDKLKSAYGTAARRTTTRRAASTRITQAKN